MGADIFISYARKDLGRVEPIARALVSLGYDVWWDANLRAGRRFDKEIEQALAAARCVLVVWTKAAVNSDWVRAEAAEALDAGKLVPVFLEPVKRPLYFRHVQGLDLGGWDGQPGHGEFQRLMRAVEELAGPGATGGTPVDPEPQGPAIVGVREPEILSVFQDRLKDGGEGPEMVWLPDGTFLMGSPDGDDLAYSNERPRHEVRIAQPFAIGRFPVTFADYDRFCAAAGRKQPADEGWGRDRRPVINVRWEDAVAYCLWLTGQTGQTYRLPSEARWEYACRAGTRTRWSFGDDRQALGDHAWFDGNAGGKTHPVGEKRANPWGLHDMHGNVWEWVKDQWHGSYQGAPEDGTAWQVTAGERLVLRGGSWIDEARYLRCAARFLDARGSHTGTAGFRVTLGPEPGK